MLKVFIVIVLYLNLDISRAFTKRGQKENTVGRKPRNYPKRNQVIRVDKVTGAIIYPEGHPNAKRIKTEQVRSEAVQEEMAPTAPDPLGLQSARLAAAQLREEEERSEIPANIDQIIDQASKGNSSFLGI